MHILVLVSAFSFYPKSSSCLEVIKLFSCSTQMCMKFVLLKNLKLIINAKKKKKKNQINNNCKFFLAKQRWASKFFGCITKTCLFKYTENLNTKKWKFSIKKFWYFFIFHVSAQNIDCGYSLGPPRWGPTIYVLSRNKKINVYPCKPQFYYIKVGFKWVKII